MTEKKARILEVALRLFALDGFNAVSTKRIALEADVSEALIFRHFKNKESLLDELRNQIPVRLSKYLLPILEEKDAKTVISRSIDMLYKVPESEYDYWRLQFLLKWDKRYYDPNHMNPLKEKLAAAFKDLKYSDHTVEAELLSHILETIAAGIVRDGKEKYEAPINLLRQKYGV